MEPDPQHEVHDYFEGEKRAAGLLLAAGLGAFVTAIVLGAGEGPMRAIAFSVGAFALAEVVVGTRVYLRTDGQLQRVLRRLASDDPDVRRDEGRRMQTFLRALHRLGVGEGVVAGAGALLLATPDLAWVAVGLGLVLQGTLLLLFNRWAVRRGRLYVQALTTPWIRE